MREKGVVVLPDPHFEYKVPKFKTKSGKVELSNEKVGTTGMNPVIGYIPRKVVPAERRVLRRRRQAEHPFAHHDAAG